MSPSNVDKTSWNFRILDKRQVMVKAKNDSVRKFSVVDVLTGLPFPLEVPADFSMDTVELEKEYLATLKVYTLRNVEGVKSDFVEFFEVLDVDQTVEDFINAYWLYPNYIRFELVEVESA